MNIYEILISDTASNDLSEIVSYRKNNLSAPVSAGNLINRVRSELFRLKGNPFLFPLLKDEILKSRGIRKLNIDNIIFFYTASESNKTITIIRVLYARRDWINLL